MISNMESQLKQQGAGDRLKEVLAEVPQVRKDAGYPPLVTPSSQIVGTQAVFNVLMGRYKVLTGEFADLMLGYYGETHRRARSGKSIEAAAKQAKKEPITGRPADLLKPEWDELRAAGARRSRAATAPTRTCSPTPCSRRSRPSSSRSAPRARRTSARTRPRPAAAAAGRRRRQAGRRQGPDHEPGDLRGEGRRQVAQGDRRSRAVSETARSTR